MKISGQKGIDVAAYLQKLQEASKGGVQGPEKVGTGPGLSPNRDQVELSGKAKEVLEIAKAIEKAPEIRESRVSDVKAQIGRGAYNVRGEAVAEKMLQEHLFDKTL